MFIGLFCGSLQTVSHPLLLRYPCSVLRFTHKDVDVINDQLNRDFNSLCEWFVDNKLSIHFGEDKTKSILFTSKNKLKKVGNLSIHHGDIQIKQHSKVTYLHGDLEMEVWLPTYFFRLNYFI